MKLLYLEQDAAFKTQLKERISDESSDKRVSFYKRKGTMLES